MSDGKKEDRPAICSRRDCGWHAEHSQIGEGKDDNLSHLDFFVHLYHRIIHRWQNGKQCKRKTKTVCTIFVSVEDAHCAKFKENFPKHEIKNLLKFGEITKTKILQPPYNLLSATHPPLPSARRFFNVARQCYFEMKTNTKHTFPFCHL